MNIPSLPDEFSWTFDGIYDINNGSLTSPNISLVYNTCGNYEASLLLTDNNGCLAYDTIPYTVACNSSTDLNISTSEACVNDTVYLITSSINTQWSSSFEKVFKISLFFLKLSAE